MYLKLKWSSIKKQALVRLFHGIVGHLNRYEN